MDRTKFSTIAHSDHVYCNPVSPAKLDLVLDLLELQPGESVFDVGCGKGELLLRLIERLGVKGSGVDTNASFLEEAMARAAARNLDAVLTLHHQDARTFEGDGQLFSAAVCVGSTHAYGDLRTTLRTLAKMVRPGGYILIGEGYWKAEPSLDYLAALGASRSDLGDHASNVAAGIDEGLIPLYSTVSSDDEWDHYEGMYLRNVERYVRNHPEDPDGPAMLLRIRHWRDTYFRYGRSTLGFGLYLFQR